MDDFIVKAITQIANADRVKKYCEPNLVWHEDIKENQTERVLYALELFVQECEYETGLFENP